MPSPHHQTYKRKGNCNCLEWITYTHTLKHPSCLYMWIWEHIHSCVKGRSSVCKKMENPKRDSPAFNHQPVKTRWTEILTSRNYVANSGDSLSKERCSPRCAQVSVSLPRMEFWELEKLADNNNFRHRFSRVLFDILVISSLQGRGHKETC